MNNTKFTKTVDEEGWLYVLTQVDPNVVEDVLLAEALYNAQMAFEDLRDAAPFVDNELFKSAEDEDVDDEYLVDDEFDDVPDLVELFGLDRREDDY